MFIYIHILIYQLHTELGRHSWINTNSLATQKITPNHNPILSSFMTCHHIFSPRVTRWLPPVKRELLIVWDTRVHPCFIVGVVLLNFFFFWVVFCGWPLHLLSFDLWLVSCWVSSNFSMKTWKLFSIKFFLDQVKK